MHNNRKRKIEEEEREGCKDMRKKEVRGRERETYGEVKREKGSWGEGRVKMCMCAWPVYMHEVVDNTSL